MFDLVRQAGRAHKESGTGNGEASSGAPTLAAAISREVRDHGG